MSDEYRNALAEGTVLDTYRIERVLGEGGFGVTYLVTELNLGKEYAIKELIPDGVAIRQGGTTVMARSSSMEEDFEATRRHFIKEARVLATLKHPAIVAVHRLFEANGTCYMVMDYVEGETLGAYLKRQGGMLGSRAEFEGIFYPLMNGLELLHGKDMIHRDIKPGNIMVTPNGSPVLLDFGASCRVENHTVTVTQMVSAGYSPFEQYTTRAKQGPYTDIYALGATMVRAITGAKPDDATDRMIGDTYSSLTARSELVPVYGWELLSALDTSVMVKIEERPQTVRDWRKLMEVVVAPAEVELPESTSPQLEERRSKSAPPPPLPTIDLPTIELPQATVNYRSPELWNPNATANWSLLFTPIFGAWLQAKNWKELGQPDRAQKSMLWMYAGFIPLIINLFLIPENDIGWLPIYFLIAWYFSSSKTQVEYLKENTIHFEKKKFGTPLLFGLGGWLAYIVIGILFISFAGDSKSSEKESSPKTDVLIAKREVIKPKKKPVLEKEKVIDSEFYTIGGEVWYPGQKKLTEGVTLYSAIQRAGGESKNADMNRVRLYRNGKKYEYDMKRQEYKGVKIYARDVIEVASLNKTDPNDPDDYGALVQKLEVVKVESDMWRLLFTTVLGKGYRFDYNYVPFGKKLVSNRIPAFKGITVGDSFFSSEPGLGRFKLKKVRNDFLFSGVSRYWATIEDCKTKKQFDLPLNAKKGELREITFYDHRVTLRLNAIGEEANEITLEESGSFALPANGADKVYKLTEVKLGADRKPESVVIEYNLGNGIETIEIKIPD